MAQNEHSYKQGHSASTLATHLRRTAEDDAGFLLPHIQKTHRILDVGCGPGTITTGFAKYVSEGAVVGVDISEAVLEKASSLAKEAKIPDEGNGSVTFQHGNVLGKLPFPDESVDVVYTSQVFGHLPPPDEPLKALSEIRRVLKPGGILATTDGAVSQFFPSSAGLEQHWNKRFAQMIMGKEAANQDHTGRRMPEMYRRAGFDVDGGKVQVSSRSQAYAGPEIRQWFAKRTAGQLQKGDAFYQNWVKAGITEDEIQQTLDAVNKWAETEDAWFMAAQIQVLGWK